MTYTKPEILELGNAAQVIHDTNKQASSEPDPGTTAYDLDE